MSELRFQMYRFWTMSLKVYTLISAPLNSIKLGQMIHLNMIFHNYSGVK